MTTEAAWDCHAHVIGDPDQFTMWAGRGYTPPVAPLDEYLAFLDRRGFSNGVLVQPSIYHFDNDCLLDALDRANGRLLGVAVPAPDSTPRDLEMMHDRGVRAVRCNLINPGGLELRAAVEWQPVLRSLGWHIELHAAIHAMSDLRSLLEPLDVPVVIDHMGRPEPGITDTSAPSYRQLVELVRDGVCFVKLSAPYRLSSAAPPWPDVVPLARALLAANPAACLWGSDWPHVDCSADFAEDDIAGTLIDWLPDAGLRRTVLADAPRRLFSAR